jgi:hypothetical protein
MVADILLGSLNEESDAYYALKLKDKRMKQK